MDQDAEDHGVNESDKVLVSWNSRASMGKSCFLDTVEYCGVVGELGRPIKSQAWDLQND